MNEETLTLELEQVRAENRYLRHQLDTAFDETLRLRQVVERLYALSHMALYAGTRDGVGATAQADEQPD